MEPSLRWRWWLGLALVGTVLGSPALSAPRAKSPRTVVDYYMLLPNSYFIYSNHRDSLLTPLYGAIVDIRNGYLSAGCDGAQLCLEMCLFKRPNGSYLAAVCSNRANDGVWEPSLDFYAYQKGRLVEVTRRTLPRRFSEKLGYKLPRYGTTIAVITESGNRVYDLVWTRGTFQVKRKSHRT